MEPVQAAGGVHPPPEGYLSAVRALCDHHDVLLVLDEVVCGFGRLGHWFGGHRYGVVPDIMTVAKGLTSAYIPMGAAIAIGEGARRSWTRRAPSSSCTATPTAAIRPPASPVSPSSTSSSGKAWWTTAGRSGRTCNGASRR